MGLTEHRLAIETAKHYFGVLTPPKSLGWGISGSVFLSPQAEYAVKVHHRREGYETERNVYRRLSRLRITTLFGLTIPRMWDCDDDLQLIQMDYVTSPYLLDFAGVLFRAPQFEKERLTEWHAEIDSAYGPENSWIPHTVYAELSKHGMYYVDIRLSNLKLDGHPDYVPPPKLTWDDL